MPRYVVLEHTGAPNDPKGRHLDLLLEDGESCRTWRLDELPELNGAAQDATPLPPHRLIWLERESAAVSGGRGWASRVVAGSYAGQLPTHETATVNVTLSGMDALGLPKAIQLTIEGGACRFFRIP